MLLDQVGLRCVSYDYNGGKSVRDPSGGSFRVRSLGGSASVRVRTDGSAAGAVYEADTGAGGRGPSSPAASSLPLIKPAAPVVKKLPSGKEATEALEALKDVRESIAACVRSFSVDALAGSEAAEQPKYQYQRVCKQMIHDILRATIHAEDDGLKVRLHGISCSLIIRLFVYAVSFATVV